LSGGIEAHWRRDGKELFYIADGKIMAVPVKTDASVFEYGTPTALFATRLPAVVGRNRYVAAADGQRFLLNVLIDEGTSPLNIVLNWTAELKN